MSRIRTVKPELFKHEGLFEAETNSKLPLRLAFIGLLTCCDREGRFRWRPQRLKLDMLPYDNTDIAEVLDALAKYDFIKKYEHQGEYYGSIPSFSRHQHINNRELPSDIPAPLESIPLTIKTSENIETTTVPDACITREACVTEPSELRTCMHQRNMEYGREYGKEGERNMNVVASATRRHLVVPPVQQIFKHWKTVMKHPDAKLDTKRKMLIDKALDLGYDVEQLCNAIIGCSVTPHNIGNNTQGQRYDGLHIILRDADQIDRFIHHYHQPPQPIRDVDQRTQGNAHALERWVNKKIQEEADNAKS